MTPRLDWDVRIPPELRPAIEAILTPLLWLIPAWCYSLEVRWETSAGDAEPGDVVVAAMDTTFDRRHAIMTLYPYWLTLDDVARRALLTHEVLHIVLQPMVDARRAAMDTLDGKKPIKAQLDARWMLAWEGAVCDLTAILGAK